MIYSDFAIVELGKRLREKAMRSTTPKKYANDMFEAAEVIEQLRAAKEDESVAYKGRENDETD